MQMLKVKSSHRDQKKTSNVFRSAFALNWVVCWSECIPFECLTRHCVNKLFDEVFSWMTTHAHHHSVTEMLIHHKKILRILTHFKWFYCITIAKAPEIRNYFCQVAKELFHMKMETQPIHRIFCWMNGAWSL